MRSILIPYEHSDSIGSVLTAAMLAGQRFGSYIEGVYVQPALPAIASADGFGVVTPAFVEKYEEEDRSRIQEAEATFTGFMRRHDIPVGKDVPERGLRALWQNVGPSEDYVGHRGRLFDLIVVGRPVHGATVPTMHTLEAALFESGRPLLIAPPKAPEKLGDTIVIAWNGSTETARTIAFAMPFLKEAKKVVVVTIADVTVPGPSGAAVARSLRRSDIPATAEEEESGRRGPGEAMLQAAYDRGADMMIKGAYTHSRLRQMIFGGATSQILSMAELPVFMAH